MYIKCIVVLGFIGGDIVSGLIKAFYNGDFTSSVMRDGLLHKLAEILAVAFGALLDYALPVIGVTVPVSMFSAIVVYVCFMEAGSIIENLGNVFPELGKYLSEVFQKVEKP